MRPRSQGKKRARAHVEETGACWVGRVLVSARGFGEGFIQVYLLADQHRKVVGQDRGMGRVSSLIQHAMST